MSARCPTVSLPRLYLCAAHPNANEVCLNVGCSATSLTITTQHECCAIDYTVHTLDGATALLNSSRYFPSRWARPCPSEKTPVKLSRTDSASRRRRSSTLRPSPDASTASSRTPISTIATSSRPARRKRPFTPASSPFASTTPSYPPTCSSSRRATARRTRRRTTGALEHLMPVHDTCTVPSGARRPCTVTSSSSASSPAPWPWPPSTSPAPSPRSTC